MVDHSHARDSEGMLEKSSAGERGARSPGHKSSDYGSQTAAGAAISTLTALVGWCASHLPDQRGKGAAV
jgi:hypothetical protein